MLSAYENYNNYVIGGADEALVAGAFNAYANFELSNYLETDAGSIMKCVVSTPPRSFPR